MVLSVVLLRMSLVFPRDSEGLVLMLIATIGVAVLSMSLHHGSFGVWHAAPKVRKRKHSKRPRRF